MTKLVEYQNDINDVIEENDISVREAIHKYGTDLLELMFVFAEADGRMKRERARVLIQEAEMYILRQLRNCTMKFLKEETAWILRDWQSTEAT